MPSGSSTFAAIGDLNQAAQILLAALPLAALALVGALVFFSLLWDHQRRLMIISRGGTPPPRLRGERLVLLGVVSLFVGVALLLFFWGSGAARETMLIGIVPAAAGLGILAYQRLTRRGVDRDRGGA